MTAIRPVSVFREILRRSIWVTAGSIIGRALPLLAGVILTRTFGLEKFAVIGLVLTWIAVVPSLTTWGIGLVATQMMASRGADYYFDIVKWSVLSSLFALVLIQLLLFSIGGSWLAKIYPGIPITDIGPATLATGVCTSIFVLIQAFFNGAHQPKKLAGLLATSGILQGLALGCLVLQGDISNGPLFVLIGAFITSAIAGISFYSILMGNRDSRKSAGLDVVLWLRKIIPAILSSASVAPVTFICASMITASADGPRELGAFFALEQIGMVLTYIPTLIAQSTVPVLSRLIQEDEGKAVSYVLRMAKYQFLALAAVLCVAVATAPILLSLYGQLSDFRYAYFLLLANVLISVPLGTIGTYLQAAGKFVTGSVLNFVWAGLFVVASILLREGGAAGIEASRLIATCLLGVLTLVLIYLSVRRFEPGKIIKEAV